MEVLVQDLEAVAKSQAKVFQENKCKVVEELLCKR
jgi:hypothetical protein